MKVISIGSPLQSCRGFQVTQVDLFSKHTFLDADLIIWDVLKSLKSHNTYTPGSVIKSNTYDRLQAMALNRRHELIEYLEAGRSLVLHSPHLQEIKYGIMEDAGAEEVIFNPQDFFEGFIIPKYEAMIGDTFSPIDNEEIVSFHSATSQFLGYSLRFLEVTGTPLLYMNRTDHVVSQCYKVKNGFVWLFPDILHLPNQDDHRTLLSHIIHTISSFNKLIPDKQIEVPKWSAQYRSSHEYQISQELDQLQKERDGLFKKIASKEKELKSLEELKLLFSGTGDALEEVMKRVFVDIGFKLEDTESNREDSIAHYGKKSFVLEMKGIKKSAGEKQAAQLEKYVSIYLSKKGKSPKGLLIVNTYKDTLLEERKDVDFPDQMLDYSTRRDHCLLTGIQLLNLYLDFIKGEISQEDVVSLLVETIGVLDYSSDYSKHLSKV